MISKMTSQLLLSGLIIIMAATYVFTLGSDSQEIVITIATIVLLCFSLLMEKLLPLQLEWNISKGDTGGDIASLIIVFGIVESALKWLSPIIILVVLPDFQSTLAWPLWQQILLATLLIELGAWLSHWAHHKYKILWALHAMHHSTERLYTLNNFRFHPLNHIINYYTMFLPLLVIGISKEAILAYTALTLPVLLLQHTNVAFNFGVLNTIFNTNTVHRWHHSSNYQEGIYNFGRALLIWDHLFGTYYQPSDQTMPKAVGLASTNSLYPKADKTRAQLLWPCNKACCQ